MNVIEYNYLNLPQQITINKDNNSNAVNYLYDAMGNKLRKQTKITNVVETTTDYIGSFVYEDEGTFELRYILTPEGRVMANPDGTFNYQYFLQDHLGNTRVTFDQAGTIIQEDSYYPFGMAMSGLSHQSGTDYQNKYLYNGKELQDEFGLEWYDYGARFYDAVLGRWHVSDALADKYYSSSQYNYCLNNPINAIDPDGQLVLFVNGFRADQFVKEQVYRPSKWIRKLDRISSTDRNSYWQGFDLRYMSRVADENVRYVDGMGSGPMSMAYMRYSQGRRSARRIHRGIKNGSISYGDNETIKIAGHSHGAAHAAGMADFLAKKGYEIERFDAVASHQPNQFELKQADKIVSINQYSRKSDQVSSTGKNGIFGFSKLDKIGGVPEGNYFELKDMDTDQGGHYIQTFIQELFDFVPENSRITFTIPQSLSPVTVK